MVVCKKRPIILKYRNATIEELLNNEEALFTGFYLDVNNSKKFIYKTGESDFLLVEARNIEVINDAICKKLNDKLSKTTIKIISINGVRQKLKIKLSTISGKKM